jgi:rSAM/selenodomain-associated transferase 1
MFPAVVYEPAAREFVRTVRYFESASGESSLQDSKLIVFYKAPVWGRVKTRLAESVGRDAALSLYRAMVEDLVENLRPLWSCMMLYEADSPDIGGEEMPILEGFEKRMQRGDDLGERMYNALHQVLGECADRAVLIGTDVPYMEPLLIEEYIDTLSERDAVIGPSVDGGYYLIGFRRDTLTRAPFENVSWSTSTVRGETLRKLHEAGTDTGVGQELRDIDRLDDLKEVLQVPWIRERVPRLRRIYEEMS